MKSKKLWGPLALTMLLAAVPGCEKNSDENPSVSAQDDLVADCANRRRDVNSRVAEQCNGRDDNCDGQVDEGAFICGENTYCAGAQGCLPIPPEVCDGQDNDFDDFVDEGALCGVGEYCAGQAGCLPIPEEICDNVDNNFDGQVDETFIDKGAECVVGVGACERSGVQICAANGQELDCNVQPGEPVDETCDGVDNDCDEQIDEDFNINTACTLGVGACERSGTFVCNENGGVTCNAVPGEPIVEIQNGFDDDCDGSVDEGVACVLDTDCRNPCNPLAVGACAAGYECRPIQTFNADGSIYEDFATCVPAALSFNHTVGCSLGATEEIPGVCTTGYDPDRDGEVELREDTAFEGCTNEVDDDADGLIDRRDPDCPAECVLDTDCVFGQQCVNSSCAPIPGFCVADANCVAPQVCGENNRCQDPPPPPPECVNDAGCALGNQCVNGSCAPIPGFCVADANCVAPQVCGENNRCQDPPPPPPAVCTGNEDCAQGDICVAGACVAGPLQGQCSAFAVRVTHIVNQQPVYVEWFGQQNPTRNADVADGLYRSNVGECSVSVFDFASCTCETRFGASPCAELPASPGVWGCRHNQPGQPN